MLRVGFTPCAVAVPVDHPDAGPDTFMEKLQGQLKATSTAARQLAAEMIWSLLRHLDDAMLALRRKLEQEHPEATLDFYEPPLLWKRLAGKPVEEFGVASSDAYQMHAYASAYGCREMTLIYPWHSRLRASSGHFYRLSSTGPVKPLLRLGFVDVTRSPLMLVGLEAW